MAKVTINQFRTRQFGGFTPYGNATSLTYGFKTGSDGSPVDADSSDPLADGDVIDLGRLPEGMRLEDASLFVKTGMTATIKGKLGFLYEDGEDSAEVPQDDAYFMSGADMAAAGRTRATNSSMVVLPKTARLVLTVTAADNAKESDVEVLVTGELTGPR